ncbi:hypothetical protein ACFQFC_36090 [Amorphoplanes digitatis]|uniref:hypothetical protein n=1 Tax=Actinoplanes digitatis TaxID=1868 RepID=UPI00361A2FD7
MLKLVHDHQRRRVGVRHAAEGHAAEGKTRRRAGGALTVAGLLRVGERHHRAQAGADDEGVAGMVGGDQAPGLVQVGLERLDGVRAERFGRPVVEAGPVRVVILQVDAPRRVVAEREETVRAPA